ncbi:hypothetical protein Drorol1_Dr00015960 [Drosera rotundifolia]
MDIISGVSDIPPTNVDVCCTDKASNRKPDLVLKPSSFDCRLKDCANFQCSQKMDPDAQAGFCAKEDQFDILREKKDSYYQSDQILDEWETHEVESFPVDLSISSISNEPPVVISRRTLKKHKMFKSPTM